MTARTSLEPLECQRLRQLIEKSVRAGDSADALAHLQSSESLPHFGREESLGLQVLGQGFGGGMSSPDRTSFAAYCMKHLQEHVLDAVLRSNLAPRKVLASKVTSWYSIVISKRNGRPAAATRGVAAHSQPMLDSAFRLTSARGMRLAIEFEAHTKRLHEPVRASPLASAKTSHADALDFATAFVRNAGFSESLEVCRVFVENRLPAVADGSTHFVLETLTSSGGSSVDRESMRTLFRLYADAGYIDDLELRLGPSQAGKRPLAAAVDADNREVAMELVRLGADVSLVGEDFDMPGADILEVIASLQAVRCGEFIAEVAEALMRRGIAGHSKPPAQALDRRRKLVV